MSVHSLSPVENLQRLMGRLDQLGESRDFAESLVRQYRDHGDLSPKQWSWVDRLYARTENECVRAGETVSDLGEVVALFDRVAAGKLKYPKLTFDETAVGVPLQLSRAGAQARQPGSVNATDGRPFGQNIWYGRIERNGTFVPGRDCPAELVPFLKKLGTDTANVAAMYGRRTGSCCFCGLGLTDERSIHVGYGPTCAKNWGMPYPTKSQVRAAA